MRKNPKNLYCFHKIFLFLSLGTIFFIPAFPKVNNASESIRITVRLEDVVSRISAENFQVLENALRVYQAKEAIEVSRGNLLPKLKFWEMVDIPFEPMMAIGMVSDIAPFLVPANWFRLEEQKVLHLAAQESYRALWSNELMTAKALYLKVLLDHSLLEKILENKQQFEKILEIAKSREKFGGGTQNMSRDIEVRILALSEDERSLRILIEQEKNELSYMLGYPSNTEIDLTSVDLSGFEEFEPLNYDDFEFRALDSSPEIREFGHLIETADLVKKEVAFSFLGGSEMSRGVEGGIFDALPSQQGLGFGTAPSMRIAKAQKKILKVQKRGIEEVIKRQLKVVIDNYNLDLENYANLKRRTELTKEIFDNLIERLTLGQSIETLELVEASRNQIQAESSFFAIRYRFLTNKDKLSRLIFHEDYDKKPAGIERLREN